jgi:outer membrane cobalamin receptor
LLDADFILQGGMKALSIDDPIIKTYRAITISEATDLNLKASYLVSDQFSFFIKANNILDNQYQVYLCYPVRGFQALAGLTWSF